MDNHYKEIEDIFSDIIFLLSAYFTMNEIEEVKYFLNYGEYGLALDTIIDIHAEEGKLLNVEVLDLIKKASVLMEIDVGTLIDRIG